MPSYLIDPRNLIRLAYWSAICALLFAGLAGRTDAFYAAVAVGVVQVIHYRLREERFAAFPVQVRLAYVVILLIDLLWEPMRWNLWMMAAFTLVAVVFDWCLLSRIMVLMPWNRSEPMSWNLLRATFLSGPVKGSVQKSAAAPAAPLANA